VWSSRSRVARKVHRYVPYSKFTDRELNRAVRCHHTRSILHVTQMCSYQLSRTTKTTVPTVPTANLGFSTPYLRSPGNPTEYQPNTGRKS